MKKLNFLSIIACVVMCVGTVSCGGPEAVDLGLPSGTKWASYNVGALSPEETGGFYAWGEVEEKNNYSDSTYKYANASNGYRPINIGENISGTEYDVARQKWGGDWRMPTQEEFGELIGSCRWIKIILNGVRGYKVIGPNGNSIFLPACGTRVGTELIKTGKYNTWKDRVGYYWSASSSDDGRHATEMMLASDICLTVGTSERCSGNTIRPVR
ncbi:MAG: hypothetical protein IKV83_08875 [Muribaculaceae bacterium]|nr:hypothetical protein [Muribaculaceae bacterium]